MPHFLKSVLTSLRSTTTLITNSRTTNSSPMQLAPSDIHFLAGYNQHCYKPDQNLLNSLTNRLTGQSIFKLMSSDNNANVAKINNNIYSGCNNQVTNLLPKIQVAERNGAWFALNNSYLHLYRELERQEKCFTIQVEVVPLSKVPKFIQDSMVVQLPNKPDLINWDQDDSEIAEEAAEGRPLLVHKKVSLVNAASKCSESNTDFQNIKDDLKKSYCQSAQSCCWTDQMNHKQQEKDELMMMKTELEPVHLFAHEGSGKMNKQGYHQLSDGGAGSCPEDSILAYKASMHVESETEGVSSAGTDFSDYDLEAAGDSDSEYDESLTCNVCDRSFTSDRKLMQHQQRKRHYGCSVCDSIFPNLMTLELHKESLEHWSDGDDAGFRDVNDDDEDEDDDDDDEDDDFGSQAEELERLL